MLDGNPPFQAKSEYAIFQKILKLEFQFPEGFPLLAQDFISKLLVINSKERLGAQDFGGYPSIKGHQLFASVDFESLYLTTPPRPSNCAADDVVDSASNTEDFTADAEPGLGGQQLSRLLGLQLSDETPTVITTNASSPPIISAALSKETPVSSVPTKSKTTVQWPTDEQQLQARLVQQQETIPQWHNLVDKKLILKQGLVDKRKVTQNCEIGVGFCLVQLARLIFLRHIFREFSASLGGECFY